MSDNDLHRRTQIARKKWRLTNREVDVLVLLARDGAGNQRISEELGIGASTVEQYVSRLLLKSGAVSRTELVARFWSDPAN